MSGQPISEVRSRLAAAGARPKHRYGQNFLIDLNLLYKLVAAARVGPADVVLEVGAGTGSLTQVLLATGARVIASEIDADLLPILESLLSNEPHAVLVPGDALAGKHAISPSLLSALENSPPHAGGSYKLVANLPYQIATPLIMDLQLGKPRFEVLAFTIQREVGDRLVAEPRSAAYGPISVVTQSLSEVERIAVLPPGLFWPPPKVESVMMVLTRHAAPLDGLTEPAGFAHFVQQSFAHRRKTLRWALRRGRIEPAESLLERLSVSRDARPEELSPALWRSLYREVLALRPS